MASELKEMPDPKIGRRHRLTPQQIEFFRMAKTQMENIREQMSGVLQYICLEQGITGTVTLSDDGTEIIQG